MVNPKSIVYMVLSALFFTGLNLMIRQVDRLPTFELVFFRSIGSVICCLFVLVPKKISLLGNHKGMLILRGVVGVIAMSLFFKAIQLMPLGTAVSLRYLSPFFAAGLAIVFLKESVRKIQWLFFLIAFVGVVMLKGFDTRISTMALSIILVSAFFSGAVYVIIRKIGVSEHPVVIIFYFLTIASIVGGLFSVFNWVPPKGLEWPLLFSMGIIGFFAQWLMTRALQLETANRIVPLKYTEVIFTLITGWILFGEAQSWVSLLAIMMIIAALLANIMVKSKI